MISVIVPAYNVEAYIADCLESILSQSYADLEIIVVNDGSTDRTLDIIEEYASKDNRLRIISQPNGGPSVARNKGLEMAQGEWLMFVDSDDLLLPGAIESLLHLAQATQSDIACGEFVRRINDKHQKKNKFITFNGEKALEHNLYQKYINPSPWGKLYLSDIFSNIRFPEGIIYEDLYVSWQIFLHAKKVAYSQIHVYLYNDTPDSLLHNFNSRRLDVLDVTEKIERRATEHSPELRKAARDRRLSANFNILGLIAANNASEEYKHVCDGAWSVIRSHRRDSLFNSKVRLKNKAGILLSYLGRRLTTRILARHYRKRRL